MFDTLCWSVRLKEKASTLQQRRGGPRIYRITVINDTYINQLINTLFFYLRLNLQAVKYVNNQMKNDFFLLIFIVGQELKDTSSEDSRDTTSVRMIMISRMVDM